MGVSPAEESSPVGKKSSALRRVLRWLGALHGSKRYTESLFQSLTPSSNTKRVAVVSVAGSPELGKLFIWTMNIPMDQADQLEEYSAHIVIPDWSVDLSHTKEPKDLLTTCGNLQQLQLWVEWLSHQADLGRNGNQENGNVE